MHLAKKLGMKVYDTKKKIFKRVIDPEDTKDMEPFRDVQI